MGLSARFLGMRYVRAACAALAGAQFAPLAAQAADVHGAARDVAALVAFVGGSPLDPREQAVLANETAARFKTDPAGMAKFAAQLHESLAKLPGAQALDVAEARQNLRLGFALLPDTDPARRIVESKDPTLYFDRTHKQLVTEATLSAWQKGCRWVAGLFAVPGPGDDFVPTQRIFVRDRFASLTANQKDAIVNVESTYPMAVMLVAQADKRKLASAIATDRATARDGRSFPLRAAVMLHDVDVAGMKSLFMQHLIGDTIVLNNGFSMQYFNHRAYRGTLAHSHPPVAIPVSR